MSKELHELQSEQEITTILPKPAPNRWAEVIKAWVDGKTIQLLILDEWVNYRWTYHVSPMSSDGAKYEWRIKPEPKTGWINIYGPEQHKETYILKASKEEADKTAAPNRIACIQITYTEGEGL